MVNVLPLKNIIISITNKLIVTGRIVYHKSPGFIRWILWPGKSIYNLIYKYSKILRLDMWIIEGREKTSDQEMVIAFAGLEVNKNYLAGLTFGNSCRENYLGKKWLWGLMKVIRKSKFNPSLFIFNVPYLFRIFSQSMGYIYIPCFINGETDISTEYSSIFKNKNTSLKSDISKIKKNKLDYEVTQNPSELYNFYYNMHLPYIKKTHGNESVIASYDFVIREIDKGGHFSCLLLIKKENERIAGILLGQRKNKAHLLILGIKDGNLDYVKDGVIGALFVFSIRHAQEKGFTKIHLGTSRSFLKDGVLQYKRKWNQKILISKKSGFFMKILSKTEALKGFLVNNPFIYQDKKNLKGALFITDDCYFSKDDFEKIYKEYFLNGLSKLVIYRLGQTEQKVTPNVPEEYANNIEFCSAEDLF
jgi:hypothetical protein